MLYIEQASAGSGKTYALAKIYIRDLLGEKPEGSDRYVLRKEESLRDAHSHILAVTFTNKATNEMKQRIVQKLAALASYTTNQSEKPDYLAEFVQEFGVDEQAIVRQAQVALCSLLHGYADFKVSTIDSFFQTVMRAFTAEIDELNDNYQIEIDDKTVAERSVDATMSQLRENDRNHPHSSNLLRWMRLMVEQNVNRGEGWDPFGSSSVRKSLKVFAGLIDSEVFKRHSAELDEYFDQYGDKFTDLYVAIMEAADQDVRAAHKAVVEQFELVRNTPGFDQLPDAGIKALNTLLRNLAEHLNIHNPSGIEIKKTVAAIADGSSSVFKKGACKKVNLDEVYPDITGAVANLIHLVHRWIEIDKEWSISIRNLPQLALIRVVLANRRQFLEDNNMMLLSNTNQILSSVIDRDDTPFIYERIGTYINHYLIDEFQDTSRMQWDNFRPLLQESLSRQCDNLIIGDVKQSIYRFRNADPSLISDVVPNDATLPKAPEADGLRVKESTNWRSAREIVRFNNSIFTLMSQYMPDSVRADVDLIRLYGNVVQNIRHIDQPGYVHIELMKSAQTGKLFDGIVQTPALIAQILERGYRQKDIAVLVNERSAGNEIIDRVVAYNAQLEPGQTPINIISDESLTISSSEAVQTIIAVLEMMRHPINGHGNVGDVSRMLSRYRYMQGINPDITFDEVAGLQADNVDMPIEVENMVRDMRSLSLPALIEAIAGNYLSDGMRATHAAYVAALQDLVLDYCENQPADIASFLTWWRDYGSKKCIASPETTDAVKVMTIHKSKGLEFECVILPKAQWSIGPTHRDVLWVKPQLPRTVEVDGVPLPPVIAVQSSKTLIDTPYASDYKQYCQDSVIDNLNKTYVAFTRAKRELYILAGVPSSKDTETVNIGLLLQEMLNHIPAVQNYSNRDLHIDLRHWRTVTEGSCYEYGMPTTPDSEEKKDESKRVPYYIRLDRDILHSVPGDDLTIGDDEAEDAMSPGVIMHAAMSRVRVPQDLPAALLKEVVRGNLSREEAEMWKQKIEHQMQRPEVAAWYRPDLTVINERPIFVDLSNTYRPDRVVVDSDGNATVVDYKFGDTPSAKYNKQVKRYATLLMQTGHYRTVNAYLWYVALEQVLEVKV